MRGEGLGPPSSSLLARSARSSTSLSIARVLSLSVGGAGEPARTGPTGALVPALGEAEGESRTGLAGGLLVTTAASAAALGAEPEETAGSAMRICTPHRLQRTMSRFPRTFSSAI